MRIALIALAIVCGILGGEIIVVDKVVLHGASVREDEFTDEFADETGIDPARVIDLPDSGGYVLIAIGATCLLFSVAMGRSKSGS